MKRKVMEVRWNNTAVLLASITFMVVHKAEMYGDTATHPTWIYGQVEWTHACGRQTMVPQKTDAFGMQPL